MSQPILYTVKSHAVEQHLFDITLTIPHPDPAGQQLSLPTWIPGSYMIREFSRHIENLSASSKGKPVALRQISKNRWQATACQGELNLHYQVYAYDLSVRGAYLDRQRGFFNSSSLLLMVEGQEQQACELELIAPTGKATRRWRVATSLNALKVDKKTGFGRYQATNYDELIDHPVELGEFERIRFKAGGIPHDFVVSGRFRGDLKRLAQDTKRICEYQMQLFDGPAPFKHYVFMLFVGKDIYGGLEHRASTALMASRDDLPQKGEGTISDGYLQLLGLISHEYFHNWNVKRIKPAAFTPYNLNQEAYTRLLWAFEGITSYYDDLSLVRCGLIDKTRYLRLLEKTITQVQQGNGRFKQTLEQSSFEAWTKYYRQDENSPNSIVSYYAKGALAALALDLTIRQASKHRQSLDDVMRALWAKWLEDGKGLAEDEWESLAQSVTQIDLHAFFAQALRSTEDLPLVKLLASQGVSLNFSPQADPKASQPTQASLGVKARAEPQGGVRLLHVYSGGAAQQAGLAGGDVLIALNGLKVQDIDSALTRYRKGDTVKLHVFRRDELFSVKVKLQTPAAIYGHLSLQEHGGKWLHSE